MRILGIDPGTATMGFGAIDLYKGVPVFVDCGTITTPKTSAMPRRLAMIAKDLRTLIRDLKPDVIAIEELFFAKNVTNALSVGQARGVVMLLAEEAKCEIHEYKPHQIKQAITAYGRATKPQMQQMVKTILGLKIIPKPDDAADGLAIAITCAHSLRGR